MPAPSTMTPDIATHYQAPAVRDLRCCPQCGSSVVRARRRPIDRFSSLFRHVYRYRCYADNCASEDNLPTVNVIDSDINV